MFVDVICGILALMFIYLVILVIVDRPSKRRPKQRY